MVDFKNFTEQETQQFKILAAEKNALKDKIAEY